MLNLVKSGMNVCFYLPDDILSNKYFENAFLKEQD